MCHLAAGPIQAFGVGQGCGAASLQQQESTREQLDKKLVALRDRRIVLGAVALVLLMLTGLLALKLRELRRLS